MVCDGARRRDKEAVLAPALDALVAFRDRIRAAAREQKLTPLLELCDALRDEALVDLVRARARARARERGTGGWRCAAQT